MNIKELLEFNRETEFLDYKAKVDFQYNKVDFLRDIIALANIGYDGQQYIVYGVKESEEGFELIGIDDTTFGDVADYQKLISEKIEPYIKVDFVYEEFLDNKYLVLIINADKNMRPYMAIKAYSNNGSILDIGESWIRVGTAKRKMSKNDFENIYNNRRSPLEVLLRDRMLFINDQDPAKLELLITNTSDFDRVFPEALMSIEDQNGN
jgi:predicted HTH transcriptional regulator